METSKAVEIVAGQLRKRESDLYVFQPRDQQERFFIGEAFIVAASMMLITAFLKGMKAGLEKEIEKWGEEVSRWLVEKLEQLFRSPPKSADLAPLAEEVESTRFALSGADAAHQAAVVEETRSVLIQLLYTREINKARVQTYVLAAEEAALSLVRK